MQVLRRVSESWGERSTLQRAVQRICSGFVDWGAVRATEKRAVYGVIGAPRTVGAAASRLLVEGLVVGGGKSACSVVELLNHPALFPFVLGTDARDLRTAGEFRVERQGAPLDGASVSGSNNHSMGHP